MQWSMENANVQTRKKERMLPPYCARRFLQDLKLVASLFSMLRQMQGLSFAPLQFEITDHRESKRVFDVCVLVCFGWLREVGPILLLARSMQSIAMIKTHSFVRCFATWRTEFRSLASNLFDCRISADQSRQIADTSSIFVDRYRCCLLHNA